MVNQMVGTILGFVVRGLLSLVGLFFLISMFTAALLILAGLFSLIGVLTAALVVLAGQFLLVSLLTAALLVLAVWLMRAFWTRLAGQAVSPWTFQADKQEIWSHFYHLPGPGSPPQRDESDVMDVEIKKIGPPSH